MSLSAEDVCRMDAEAWFLRYGVLKDKSGRVTRFPNLKPTPVQAKMFAHYRKCRQERRPCLMLVLKPRKDGASTGAQAITYHHLRNFAGRLGAQMGDKTGTSTNLFEMFRAFYDGDLFGWGQGPADAKRNLDDEITMPNGSQYVKQTAGSTNAGRSATPQVANATEVAFFPKGDGGRDPALGFLNSASLDGEESLAVWDTTPNGASGVFYDYWQDKTNDWEKIFVAWFENEEHALPFETEAEREAFVKAPEWKGYEEGEEQERFNVTLEQLKWRRWTIKNKCQGDVNKFRQENPSDPVSCLTAETRIGTCRGMVRIADVEVGARCDHGVVSAKEARGVRPVFLVTTSSGYQIRATSDHLVGLAGNGFAPVGQLVGKVVKLQRPVLATDYHVERWVGFGGIEHALRIDERWGAFLGYYMGDGCLCCDTLSFSSDKRDEDLHDKVKKLTDDLFGLKLYARIGGTKKGCLEQRVATQQFGPLFMRLGWAERGEYRNIKATQEGSAAKRKVCVPECIWRSPRPVVREFLRWLFEADGWASTTDPRVKFFSKETAFVRDVQRLLLAFGVTCTINPVVRKLNGKSFPGFEMALCAAEARRFFDEIGFVSNRKSAGAARNWVPSCVGHPPRRLNYEDEVMSVVPDGEEMTWDLQIDSEPVFGANGILVHNCFLSGGRPRFNLRNVDMMIKRAQQIRPRLGELTEQATGGVTFMPDDAGTIELFEEPRYGLRYLGVADSMTGEDQVVSGTTADPDYHALGIIRAGFIDGANGQWNPPRLVCLHRSQIEIEVATNIMAWMSEWYGECLVVPEVNNCGLYMTKKLSEMGIPVYRRPVGRELQGIDYALGWKTDPRTKKAIIDHLAGAVVKWKPDARTFDVESLVALDEMLTFVTQDRGQPKAMPGHHDDTVVMMAIGLFNMEAATEYMPRRKPRSRVDEINTRQGWRRL